MADGHGRDVVVFRKGQQHFQFTAQHGSGWMRLVQRRAVARQPAAAVGKGRKVRGGERGQSVLERCPGVPGQNLLRAILKEPGEEGGAFRDQMAGHVPFHDRKCPLEIARRVIVLHRGNEFVLRREPVAAAAVDGLPLFAWKCTEQAQQQAPEYGVDVYTPLPSRRRTNEFCRTSASRAARVSVPQQKSACGRVNCSSGQSAKSMSRTSGESER